MISVEKIVITGMGTVNPLGSSVEETWRKVLNGISGVGPITLFNAQDFRVQIAAEVKDFQPEKVMAIKEIRRRDRYQIFALVAAYEAIYQAGINDLSSPHIDPRRIGVIVSSAIGGLTTLHEGIEIVNNEGPRRLGPFIIPMLMANGAAGLIAIDHGFQGPSMSVASACASGSDGIGMAWIMLQSGLVDVVVAGGSDATITPVAVGSFDRLGAMSRRNIQSGEGLYLTPQPFDLHRDGLVMGEGAGVLILEKESHAVKRGANILAELAGYSATADAYHITAPSENGEGGARAIRQALYSAKVDHRDVNYVNAHGTATMLNDLSESRAIKQVFGVQTSSLPVSSTKSMTGHMMGATGALESIFCVMAIRDGWIPPTINYETPDPDCDLDCVPNQSRQQANTVTISNAFGFGGHNSVLVFRKYR
jgi:3-oxoacyl-[acyl-carrier-protein] synthase II